jgi:hypothetical protein
MQPGPILVVEIVALIDREQLDDGRPRGLLESDVYGVRFVRRVNLRIFS